MGLGLKIIFPLFITTITILIAQTPPPMAPEVWSEPILIEVLGIGGEHSISRGGDTLVIYKGSLGIQMSYKRENVWQTPFPLNSHINYGLAHTTIISADGKKINFVDYERTGGFGSWEMININKLCF
jgi:hypothetical protein